MRKYTCNNPKCQKIFHRYPSQVTNEETVTCSPKCRGAVQSITSVGSNNPNYKGNDLKRICNCGKSKDERSKLCALCAGRGFMRGVESIKTYKQIKAVNEVMLALRSNKLGSASARLVELHENGVLAVEVLRSNSYVDLSNKVEINRVILTKTLPTLGYSTDHFISNPHTVETVLTKGDKRRNAVVRKFVLDNALLEYVCCRCGSGPVWCNEELTLELDHIDGDATNNLIENLRFLCPNCHTQTPTSRGRNKKKGK